LVDTLTSDDDKLLQVALEGIDNILSKWGNKEATEVGEPNEFVLRLDEKGGLNKIEGLQTHPNNEIYEASAKIIEKHFGMDEQPNEPMEILTSTNPNLENQFNF
jgi:importin subunit alpha-1